MRNWPRVRVRVLEQRCWGCHGREPGTVRSSAGFSRGCPERRNSRTRRSRWQRGAEPDGTGHPENRRTVYAAGAQSSRTPKLPPSRVGSPLVLPGPRRRPPRLVRPRPGGRSASLRGRPVPALNDPWVRTPIDAFVAAKLAEHKLKPAREADRRPGSTRLHGPARSAAHRGASRKIRGESARPMPYGEADRRVTRFSSIR